MQYTGNVASRLSHEAEKIGTKFGELQLLLLAEGAALNHVQAREYLVHGAARRINVCKRSIANVFELFPTDTIARLDTDILMDVQINIHAFLINLSGVFDNLAWAFAHRHALVSKIGGRTKVGLFLGPTQKYLPLDFEKYLTSGHMEIWQKQSLKNYRDALAHRIPLYVPPAEFTREEGDRFNRLEMEKAEQIKTRSWDRINEIQNEQALIGAPCFSLPHSFFENEPKSNMAMHPRLINDSLRVIECIEIFLKHWHQHRELAIYKSAKA